MSIVTLFPFPSVLYDVPNSWHIELSYIFKANRNLDKQNLVHRAEMSPFPKIK